MSDKLLGGKMMDAVEIGGKIYIAEPDVRDAVNAALATNVQRNERIEALERERDDMAKKFIAANLRVVELEQQSKSGHSVCICGMGPIGGCRTCDREMFPQSDSGHSRGARAIARLRGWLCEPWKEGQYHAPVGCGSGSKPCSCAEIGEALADLEAILSELPERWVSVSERMPAEDTEVLAYMRPTNTHEPPEQPYISVMRLSKFYGRGREGRLTWIDNSTGDDATSYGYADYGVTHWMPLPEPPDSVHTRGHSVGRDPSLTLAEQAKRDGIPCGLCGGQGMWAPDRCPQCGGSRKPAEAHSGGHSVACPGCHGSGFVSCGGGAAVPCPRCSESRGGNAK